MNEWFYGYYDEPTPIQRPAGRPATYTEEIGELIANYLGDGMTLKAICEQDGMPTRMTVFRWEGKYPEFKAMLEAARAAYLEDKCVEMEKIAEGTPGCDHVTAENGDTKTIREVLDRSKLRIDTIKWILGKRLPKVYAEPNALAPRAEAEPIVPAVVAPKRTSPVFQLIERAKV